jgi:helicase MOV-10
VPSNATADLIASRLASHLNPKQLFHFYAPSHSKDSIPDDLQDYAYTDRKGTFSIPSDPSPKEALSAFHMIVTTCQSGSIAHGIGLLRGLFTHISIDEPGQATEPETLVSIRTMVDMRTNVVLSGDPRQLGPVIRSKVATSRTVVTNEIKLLSLVGSCGDLVDCERTWQFSDAIHLPCNFSVDFFNIRDFGNLVELSRAS